MRCALFLLLLPIATSLAEDPALAEAKATYVKADRGLNQAWTAIKKTLPAKVFEGLQSKQREWIKLRERQAVEASGQSKPDGDAKRSAGYWQTAAKLTAERAEWLRWLAKKQASPLTGLWIDDNSGMIEIVERKNQLLFVIHVVRRYNVGALSGTADWNGTIGLFSDKGREPDKDDETTLSFTFRDGYLEVDGTNTSYYHGNRAFFDGSYYRIAPLSEKEQQTVIAAAESGKLPD